METFAVTVYYQVKFFNIKSGEEMTDVNILQPQQQISHLVEANTHSEVYDKVMNFYKEKNTNNPRSKYIIYNIVIGETIK